MGRVGIADARQHLFVDVVRFLELAYAREKLGDGRQLLVRVRARVRARVVHRLGRSGRRGKGEREMEMERAQYIFMPISLSPFSELIILGQYGR